MRTDALFLAVLACALALPANGQPRRGGTPAGGVPIEVSLEIGTRNYEARGQGECKAAPEASIHGVRAALYSVSHRAEGRSLRLTLWRPKDGSPDMMNLDLSEGSRRHAVDTVKAGAKKDTRGSGKLTFQPAAEGGTFTLDAVSAGGEKIRGTIRCGRFGAVRAEGG